jgi:hypothetical protein
MLADQGLVKGKRVAIDATTLEANAAMRFERAWLEKRGPAGAFN